MKTLQPQPGSPLTSWRAGGTKDFAGWLMGEALVDINDVRVGDVILAESVQFDALNLCRVEEFPELPEKGNRCYAVFVDPADPSKKRAPGDNQFCIWKHEFESQTDSRYYRVTRRSARERRPHIVCDHHTNGVIFRGTEEQVTEWLVKNPQYPVQAESSRDDCHMYFVTFVDC
ncbi:hypothetical protein F6X40_36435 [Paraburkholderia sp. UCT31]|uniref:hypothetical protein n=1 Tax=Paraburkholderia sp. UCT31 TaxID=2615209 RepID=UPI001655A9A6|nr:hypothetical protein [Paraburkholderia sp. UCT31]MBC8742030.1 hypothetical protein [Paraburkholderia sp. UCT31]